MGDIPLAGPQPSGIERDYARRKYAELAYAWWSVVGTAVGTAVAIAIAVQDRGVDVFYVAIAVVSTLLTGFGVSAGLHRYFSHYSFGAKPPMRLALAVLGIASGQGYFARWVYDHRVHHRKTDAPGDPHSPWYRGNRPLAGLSGLLHAHCLWLFRDREPIRKYLVRDFASDPVLRRLDAYSPLIALAGVLTAGLLGLVYEGSSRGLALGVLWGGCVRMFVLNHIVWAVNSFGHRFGSKAPRDSSQARNNWVLGVLAFGDGWHSNHHAAPFSARHGWSLGQVDASFSVLSLLARFGWVHHLRDVGRRPESH